MFRPSDILKYLSFRNRPWYRACDDLPSGHSAYPSSAPAGHPDRTCHAAVHCRPEGSRHSARNISMPIALVINQFNERSSISLDGRVAGARLATESKGMNRQSPQLGGFRMGAIAALNTPKIIPAHKNTVVRRTDGLLSQTVGASCGLQPTCTISPIKALRLVGTVSSYSRGQSIRRLCPCSRQRCTFTNVGQTCHWQPCL
jgi:putative component of membrane protein insertase Oxa1/YidC/SpoIIIJ protein YidD